MFRLSLATEKAITLVYPAAADNVTPTIETRGLEQFGFMELLFHAPKKEPSQYIEILYVMARQQITGESIAIWI